MVKIWERREPIKSVAIWSVCLFVLLEAVLLISGKWMFIHQGSRTADDSFALDGTYYRPSEQWQVKTCTYWTGRSIQSVDASDRYSSGPMECPFTIEAM